MEKHRADVRPPVHLLAAESQLVTNLALGVEHTDPLLASMLLEEIERAELHEESSLPSDAITIGTKVSFLDERTSQLQNVELVLPADANIAEGRISIMTPIGAALYGLRAGSRIEWPDIRGNVRPLKIVGVSQPAHGPSD